MGYNFHKLTNEIKEYFIKQGVGQADVPQAIEFKSGKVILSNNPPSKFKAAIKETSCEFCKKLNTLIEIERIEVFPDEPDDPEVIIIFKENNIISCIVFSDKLACVEIILNGRILNIPFNYDFQVGTTNVSGLLDSEYKEYSSKGRQKLFEDILHFVENVVQQKVHIDFLSSFKSIFNSFALFEKCRIYMSPDETIACSKKWKKEYTSNSRLKTMIIGDTNKKYNP